MADNGDIMDLDGNDEVKVEHVMRQMPRYTNIRRRYHAMNMLNRMHADELSSQLNRIKNSLPLAMYMYVEEDLDVEILLVILMLYQTVNDDLINLITWIPPVLPIISQANKNRLIESLTDEQIYNMGGFNMKCFDLFNIINLHFFKQDIKPSSVLEKGEELGPREHSI